MNAMITIDDALQRLDAQREFLDRCAADGRNLISPDCLLAIASGNASASEAYDAHRETMSAIESGLMPLQDYLDCCIAPLIIGKDPRTVFESLAVDFGWETAIDEDRMECDGWEEYTEYACPLYPDSLIAVYYEHPGHTAYAIRERESMS